MYLVAKNKVEPNTILEGHILSCFFFFLFKATWDYSTFDQNNKNKCNIYVGLYLYINGIEK